MQQRKIIDLKVENIFNQSEHPRHTIMLTYDNASKKKIFLYGNELSRILDKNFESVHLKEIFINGEFHGQFKLEATVKNYFGGYRLHREILDLNDVIALFNERGHLVDLDNKKNLLDLYKEIQQTPINNDIEEEKELLYMSYNPDKYMFGPLYNEMHEPIYNAIEINCHADTDGPYIAYRLIGMDK